MKWPRKTRCRLETDLALCQVQLRRYRRPLLVWLCVQCGDLHSTGVSHDEASELMRRGAREYRNPDHEAIRALQGDDPQ